MSENINLTINVSTNLLNKYMTQKQPIVETKVTAIPKDEVVITKKEEKRKGTPVLKTILGFGSSATIGGFAGKLFEENKIPQIKENLKKKSENLYNKLCHFKDSSAVTENGKNNYEKLTRSLTSINRFNGVNEKCMLFEGQDKNAADKIMDWIGNTCNKEYKVIDFDTDGFNFGNILNEGEKSDKIRLFRAENMDKLIKNNSENSVIKTMKNYMSDCGQEKQSILMFHTKDFNELDEIARANQRITQHFKVDEMKDFDKYTDLYKKYQKSENILSKISKTTKTKAVAFGTIAGLAVAASIFAIIKIKNKVKNNED